MTVSRHRPCAEIPPEMGRPILPSGRHKRAPGAHLDGTDLRGGGVEVGRRRESAGCVQVVERDLFLLGFADQPAAVRGEREMSVLAAEATDHRSVEPPQNIAEILLDASLARPPEFAGQAQRLHSFTGQAQRLHLKDLDRAVADLRHLLSFAGQATPP